MNEKKQDIVDRYIRNDMSAQERHGFEQQIKIDAELKELYDFTKNVQDALKSRNDKIKQIQSWQKKKSDHTLVYKIVGIAALFIGITILILPPPVPKDYSSPSFGYTDGDFVEKRISYRGGPSVDNIYHLIEEGNFSLALQKVNDELALKKEEKNKLTDSTAYLSTEEREMLEYERSIIELDSEELYWLKVKALIGLDRKEEALLLLDYIRKLGGMYQGEADKLYQELANK